MKKLHLFSVTLLILFNPYTVGATIISSTLSDPITILGTDYIVTFSQSDTIGENSFSNIDPGLTFMVPGDYSRAYAAGNEIAAALPDSFEIFPELPGLGGNGFIIPYDLGGPTVAILAVSLSDGSCCTSLANIYNDPDSWLNGPWASFQEVAVVPVPLPASAWLFASGLIGLVDIRRRAKR